MLYREILILTLIASLIAAPLAYWLAGKLLESFAYRASFSIIVLLYTMAGAFIISLLTVSWHSIKASSGNPANYLKFE